MASFFKKLFLFLLPLLIFAGGSEYLVRRIPNDYLFKNDYLTRHAQTIELLVLGSSHSYFDVNPVFFSCPAFNAAHVSQSLKYDYFIFEKFKKNFSRLKVVLLPISYFSLFYSLEDSVEGWRAKNYAVYYGCRYHPGLYLRPLIAGLKPLTIWERVEKYFKAQPLKTVSDLGFGLAFTHVVPLDLKITGEEAALRHTMKSLALLDENLGILEKLLKECRDMDVRVVLFTPPAASFYVNALDAHQLDVMEKIISTLERQYSNIRYYNFYGDSRFCVENFRDGDHLNGDGAEKFTRVLDQLIFHRD